MSEITPNPNDLVKRVRFGVRSANVIPTPIDPTLTIQGEAADAKATGDAIVGVIGNLRVNAKAPVNNAITVYATDIPMSNAEGAQTVSETILSIEDKDASEIMYDTTNLVSVKDAIDGIKTDIDTAITDDEIDDIFDEVFGGDE